MLWESRLSRTRSFVLVLCLIGLGGCTAPGVTEPAGADLRVAVGEGLDALPFIVAAEAGFFEEAGLTVELVPVRHWRDVEVLLQAGAVDAAQGSLFTLARLQQQGFLVMGASNCGAAYTLVTSSGRSGSFTALIGAAVALSDNPFEQYLLEMLLAGRGLEPGDVQMEVKRYPDEALEAFLLEEADAAFLPWHLGEAAVLAGGACLASTVEEGLPGGVVIFSGETLQEKGSLPALFNRGLAEAVKAMNRDSEPYLAVLLEKWGYPAWWGEKVGGLFSEPRPLGRDEVNDALAWMKSGTEEGAVVSTYEGLVWKDRSRE